MKNRAILVSFIALFAIAFVLNTVAAGFVSIDEVEINGIDIAEVTTSVGQVSNTIPVEIEFTALDNVSEEVKIKVYIEGYKNEISDSVTLRTPLKKGVTYRERFSLELPSSMDLDDLSEELALLVRFSAKGQESFEKEYSITMQKDLYSLNILSVDTTQEVIAGSTIPVDVVIQNNGNRRLDNVYIRVSIPDLGVERKVFFGDIAAAAEEDYDDIVDSADKRIYLAIPRNAIPGIYKVEVEAYNYDTSTLVQKKMIISGAQTGILPTLTSKTIAVGEETTFDVVLVNPNDRMVVYSLTPEESMGLIIEVSEPIVGVPADSSKSVQIRVKATKSAEEGTHLVKINVNSESGLVKQVSFSVSVEKEAAARANSVLILTVILAIIFVVLLIVLIVLLTKKPAEAEEFGETSYY